MLKPEGRIALSVWGRKEHSPYFTVLPKIMRQHGVEFPPNKSYFHLSEDLYQVVKQAGFREIKHEYIPVNMNYSMEQWLYSILISPFYQQIWKSIDTKTQESIKQKFEVSYTFYSCKFIHKSPRRYTIMNILRQLLK